MNLDLIRMVVADLAEKISGSRIDKIHQPEPDLLIMKLWNGQQNLRLLLSADSRDSRILLTEESFPNPFTPPRFCQLLRARLSRISGIEVVSDDRIVKIFCQGAKGDTCLYVELTGRRSNFILVGADGLIIDSLKRITDTNERDIKAGVKYRLPQKRDIADLKTGDLEASAKDNRSQSVVGKIYNHAGKVDSSVALVSQLAKCLKKQKKKICKRLAKIEQEIALQQGYERYRQLGDLLLAHLHLIKKGEESVTVLNYYQNPPAEETIALSSRLMPQQNAEKFFQKSKKLKRGLEHSARRREETLNELEWLEQQEYQLGGTEEAEEIALLAEELLAAGVFSEKKGRLPRRSGNKPTPFKEIETVNGFRIVWGNNSRQNDALSTKELKKGDLWFHAHRCPGSHVVLKADSAKDFTEEDILQAAAVAAANSRAKNDHKVEVVVAEAKEVRKPSGAKPGMVTVKRYNTLIVEPFIDEGMVF